jgi:two-component system cell cycle sensor histidine kinase/response regulator CckA
MASPESGGGRQGITAVLDAFPAYIAYVDHDLVYRYANKRYMELLGRDPVTIRDRPVAEVLGASAFAVAEPRLRQALGGETLFYEAEFPFPDGRRRWLAVHYIPDRVDAGDVVNGLFVFAVDISLRKIAQAEAHTLEQNLRQMQKMQAVGTLAGGVAHDFNNILQTILGYAEGLHEDPDLPEPMAEDIDVILDACRRGGSLTGQLLAFSRQQVLEPEVIEAGAAVTEVLRMIRRLIPETIELATDIAQDGCCVFADESQLAQIVVNLAVNARDAMPAGGRLEVAVAAVELDSAFCLSKPGLHAGRYASIRVSDNGEGMGEDVRERIFEPFFTTKDMGKGTGLGLATVFGIVKQHDGYIDVESTPGQGTDFTVYLPQVEPPARSATRAPLEAGANTGAVILLVEDDAAVRALVKRRLEAMGHRVLVAANGPEAVALHGEYADTVDLALLDVVLPGMDGRQAYRLMCDCTPDLKALFMSGYPLTREASAPDWDPSLPLLRKPFRTRDLQSALEQALR